MKGDDIYHKLDTTKIMELGVTQFKSLEQMYDDMLHYYHQNRLIESYM